MRQGPICGKQTRIYSGSRVILNGPVLHLQLSSKFVITSKDSCQKTTPLDRMNRADAHPEAPTRLSPGGGGATRAVPMAGTH